jgi:hypothetical protein
MESQEQVDIRYNLREWRKIQSRQICTSDKKSGLIPKVTISWKDFSPRFKNRIEHYGVLVKPKLGGYSVSCFPKALDWELEMIQETEKKIIPIRELLHEYHERRLADIKRLEKLKRLL